jgi:hypothetical protein
MLTTITLEIEEKFWNELNEIAQIENTTTENLAQKALMDYLHNKHLPTKKYSFIGIGRSGRSDISTKADEILNKGINKREGWSL